MVSSLLMSFAPATVRVYATSAKGASGGAKKEKSALDFVLGYLTKQDQFYETDPILRGADEKEGTRGSVRGGTKSGTKGGTKSSTPVAVPPKKNDGGFGGIGGFFNKK